MPIPLETFRSWIRRIYATRDQEMDCEGFFETIPEYVDVEVAGGEAYHRFPLVYRHMQGCPQCHDLYLGLRDAARSEAQEQAETMVRVRSTSRPSSSG